MQIDDPTINAQYKDFIVKSLDYVVSSLKFMSFSTKPEDMTRLTYLPYEHIVGNSKNYDDRIGQVARLRKMDAENQHLYVRARVENELPLKAMEAYCEIFDGKSNENFNHVIFPVHLPLKAHFEPEKAWIYHPLYDRVNARQFIERGHSSSSPSIKSRAKHMIFYAEMFASQVNHEMNRKPNANLFDFNVAAEDNCHKIKLAGEAYRTLSTSLEPYVMRRF